MADAPITLFIPLGNDRSNAGLTVRAESIDEVLAMIFDLNGPSNSDPDNDSKLNELLDGVLTVKAGVELKFPSTVQTSRPANTTHPQASASAPADAPTCAHGSMKYKAGTSAKGNDYKGWFCQAPQGIPGGQCKPQFIK
jgi:hypothetical protein